MEKRKLTSEMRSAPSTAGQNPSTVRASRSAAVSMSMRAFTTMVNSPRVRMRKGRERRRARGLMRAFTSPKTAATRITGQNSPTRSMPETRRAATQRATAFTKMRMMRFCM